VATPGPETGADEVQDIRLLYRVKLENYGINVTSDKNRSRKVKTSQTHVKEHLNNTHSIKKHNDKNHTEKRAMVIF